MHFFDPFETGPEIETNESVEVFYDPEEEAMSPVGLDSPQRGCLRPAYLIGLCHAG